MTFHKHQQNKQGKCLKQDKFCNNMAVKQPSTVPKNIIFGLNMIVKSGIETFLLKSLHKERWLFLLLNL
jgi:hypothetical protein